MAGQESPDPRKPTPLELDIEPTVAGRLARVLERARILRALVEAARAQHASIDLGLDVVERDSAIGGGLLAGALAYRLFVFLLPTSLLLVSGLGLYAETVDKSSTKVVEEAGLHGLIASEVASAASGRARGIVFLLMIPAVLYADPCPLPFDRHGACARLARVWARSPHHSARGRRVPGALLLQPAVLGS